MNRSITRLRAFTLSEMIVVLVITITVVGLAFSVLRLVQQQMHGIGKNYEKNTEINLLRQALWLDFHTYANIGYDARTQILLCRNENSSIGYQITKEGFLRDKDTLALSLKNVKFYFDGKEVQSGAIDAFEMTTTKEQGSQSIFVYHTNAANQYMN